MISLKDILTETRVVRYGKTIGHDRWTYLPSIHSWYSEYDGNIAPDANKNKDMHTEPNTNKAISPYDFKWLNIYKKLDNDDKEYVADYVRGYKRNFPASILKSLKIKTK